MKSRVPSLPSVRRTCSRRTTLDTHFRVLLSPPFSQGDIRLEGHPLERWARLPLVEHIKVTGFLGDMWLISREGGWIGEMLVFIKMTEITKRKRSYSIHTLEKSNRKECESFYVNSKEVRKSTELGVNKNHNLL